MGLRERRLPAKRDLTCNWLCLFEMRFGARSVDEDAFRSTQSRDAGSHSALSAFLDELLSELSSIKHKMKATCPHADRPGEEARGAAAFTRRLHAEEGGHTPLTTSCKISLMMPPLPRQPRCRAKPDADGGARASQSPHPAHRLPGLHVSCATLGAAQFQRDSQIPPLWTF